MSTFLRFFVVLFLFGLSAHSQNNTIEHKVIKGENIYRIALRYNVSMDEIFNLNPGSKELIKTGETLLIPRNRNTAVTDSDGNYKNYLVSKGETKFGISKSFGISISELERLNPFIRPMLQAGHNIRVPNNGTTVSSSTKLGEHIVVKGETLWSISQNYNLTLEELRNLNKDQTTDIISIGQVLVVSKTQSNEVVETESIQQTESTENIPSTYTVKKGDTKFGLSKRFNISIAELERLNPETIDALKTGSTLTLQDNSTASTEEPNETQLEENTEINSSSDFYVIKPKETLYSLAKKANITQEELIRLNPKLRTSVMAGDTIILKVSSADIPQVEDVVKTEIITPFKTDVFWLEPSSSNTETSIKSNVKDYFNGLNHAIASVKDKHPEMTIELKNLKQADSLQFSNNSGSAKYKIKPLPNFNYDNDITKLGTFILTHVDGSSTNETLIVKALPTPEESRVKMINYINSLDGNVICLYDKNHSLNTESIKNVISNVTFIKLNRNGSYKTKDLKESLDASKQNYVIIESSRVGVFLSTSSLLLRESSNFDIQLAVLNSQNIPSSTDISYNRFKILNLIYPMPYNPNYLKDTSESYKMGYMICSDILNRLKLYGIEGFKNGKSSSFLGTTFMYFNNDNMVENKAVSIYMFDENSDASLVGTY